MESIVSLGVVAVAVAGGWLWEIIAHRESSRLDRKLQRQLRQSADTLRESTLR